MADDKTKQAVVLYTGIRYVDADGTPLEALLGETVSLIASEFERLSDAETHPPNGAVAAPKSKDAKEAVAEAADDPNAPAT